MTHDLEHEIAAFVRPIAGVDQARELRIDLQPPVGVAVRLMTHAVGLVVRLARGGVDDHARYGDTVLLHEQARRMVDALPQAVPTPYHARRARDAGAGGKRRRERGDAHPYLTAPDVTLFAGARAAVVVPALGGRFEQGQGRLGRCQEPQGRVLARGIGAQVDVVDDGDG